jgi:hypothetical protein
MAALVMISEPGKARTVTKASAALKVVLDLVNKLCSHPLGKIASSASGMNKSSHAWNTFRNGWTNEGKEFVFAEQNRSTTVRPDGTRLVEKTYRDLWLSSTDYSEATDKLRHEVALPIANYWMKKCGIPPILQMIVRGTCFVPRPIVFEAHGPMSAYGEEWTKDSPFRSPRFVMLRQGVLMGDPLTKVCLHLVNILVRIVGEKYSTESFIKRIFPWKGTEIRKYIDSYCEDPTPAQFVFRVEKPYQPEEPNTSSTGDPVGDLLELGELEEEPPPKSPKREIKVPTPKPLNFELTWNWLQAKPKYKVSLGNGQSRELKLNPVRIKPQQTAVAEREFTFRCRKMKDFLTAYQINSEEEQRIRAENLRSEAIRQQFTLSNLRVQAPPVPKTVQAKSSTVPVVLPQTRQVPQATNRSLTDYQYPLLYQMPDTAPRPVSQAAQAWVPPSGNLYLTAEEMEMQRRHTAANSTRETQEQSCVIS